jgi:hypothetical protein
MVLGCGYQKILEGQVLVLFRKFGVHTCCSLAQLLDCVDVFLTVAMLLCQILYDDKDEIKEFKATEGISTEAQYNAGLKEAEDSSSSKPRKRNNEIAKRYHSSRKSCREEEDADGKEGNNKKSVNSKLNSEESDYLDNHETEDEEDSPDEELDADEDDFLLKQAPQTKAPATPSRRARTVAAFTPSPSKTPPSSRPKIPPTSRSIGIRGLPRGALGKCTSSGLMIRTLDGIPAGASKKSISSSLPGRLMVVSLDQDGVCPSAFAGQVFDSGDDLHKAIAKYHGRSSNSVQFATFYMEPTSDPSFSSWEFVEARLSSTGLIEEDEESTGPYVVKVNWDGSSRITGTVNWYNNGDGVTNVDRDSMQWALIEGDHLQNIPSVLLAAPVSLLEHDSVLKQESNFLNEDDIAEKAEHNSDLLPQPSKVTTKIRFPASLLQKSIRRGSGACSTVPVLEACTELIHPTKVYPGSTFAFLKTMWGTMLCDASPFQDSPDCLGLCGILLLSLIAKADPAWTLPPPLCRLAVAAALRTATSNISQQWIGFVKRLENWHKLETIPTVNMGGENQRVANLRNIMRVTQAVAGGKLLWGKWNKFLGDPAAAAVLSYLNHNEWNGSHLLLTPQPSSEEESLIDDWEKGKLVRMPTEERLIRLDKECRLAAIEPSVMPSSLVLLQAALPEPPKSWKKHSLPSLSRQVRRLISEANPRFRARMQLARLQTWGKEKGESTALTLPQVKPEKDYETYREVITPTGTLSQGEIELVDCYESIQRWQVDRSKKNAGNPLEDEPAKSFDQCVPTNCRIVAGPPLTSHEGRIAFLLAFASAIEVKVDGEVVSAMFCGDHNEPLLVQRIGKARREGKELATAGGSTSGATAVPSLGYVHRSRSIEEAKLMEAAEKEVAAYWEGGRATELPMPPPGFQWEFPNTDTVMRKAEFCDNGIGKKQWQFTIGGTRVDPFDARGVISPCKLDLDDARHRPEPLVRGSKPDRSLRIALYVKENSEADKSCKLLLPYGEGVLDALEGLHALAVSDRRNRPNEGFVYDWMPLALDSPLPSRTWRDALLAIRTRERDHVLLGKGIRSDGTGAPRDMTEGVLLRLFHALEMLYPTALKKESAFKFRVRPKGAAYHHLLVCLERLGRGGFQAQTVSATAAVAVRRKELTTFKDVKSTDLNAFDLKGSAEGPRRAKRTKVKQEQASPRKRPRRLASVAASKKVDAQMENESTRHACGTSKKPLKRQDSEDMYEEMTTLESDTADDLGAIEEDRDVDLVGAKTNRLTSEEKEYTPLPKVKTKLWPHQELSVQKVVQGVREGKRGHADASAVGAGKTLTALSTIVRLAEWIEASGRTRHGVLVMLPTKALIKEWLLEIATHTEGFHVIEQREDGTLFSLTYNKTHPPIDGNSLIISTLDRVCRHPFVRQCAWDFVVIDECLSVQNADAKRNPSAWRQIEVSMCGVLMLSATFFRSKFDS